MKKTLTESHHILEKVYGEHARAKSGFYDLKVVILAKKTKNVLSGPESHKLFEPPPLNIAPYKCILWNYKKR